MKIILIITSLALTFTFAAKAHQIHENSDVTNSDSQMELQKILHKSEVKFEASLENDVVRGIQSALYYFDGNSGYLLVKFDDKELVYKDVPLNVWMEWKFSDSISSYYKENIKYDFIHV